MIALATHIEEAASQSWYMANIAMQIIYAVTSLLCFAEGVRMVGMLTRLKRLGICNEVPLLCKYYVGWLAVFILLTVGYAYASTIRSNDITCILRVIAAMLAIYVNRIGTLIMWRDEIIYPNRNKKMDYK